VILFGGSGCRGWSLKFPPEDVFGSMVSGSGSAAGVVDG